MTGNQFKAIREEAQLTQTELSKKLKASLKTISNWELNKTKIPHHIVMAMQQIAGKEMVMSEGEDGKGMPVLAGVHTTGSVVSLFKDEHNEEPLFYLDAPEIKGCDYGVRVIGDSMYPLIRNGCYVACKTITNKEFILYGEIYHIITNDYSTVKYVHPHATKEDWVMLVPYSDSSKPTPMPKSEIIRISQVRAILQVL